MKASFIKRLSAFLIDSLILSAIISFITIGFKLDTGDISEQLSSVMEQYENNEITVEEYSDNVLELNYELQKSTLVVNVLEVVLYIGYFIIFGYLNKGQTLGKKLCKIKVVNKDGNSPSIWNMIVRSLFIYGISTLLFSTIFVNILDNKVFVYSYIIVNYVEAIFIMICFFMILYKKDGRGLHDILAKTYVIEEVK